MINNISKVYISLSDSNSSNKDISINNKEVIAYKANNKEILSPQWILDKFVNKSNNLKHTPIDWIVFILKIVNRKNNWENTKRNILKVKDHNYSLIKLIFNNIKYFIKDSYFSERVKIFFHYICFSVSFILQYIIIFFVETFFYCFGFILIGRISYFGVIIFTRFRIQKS